MLACRPMLPLALSVAAGVLAGRFCPWLAEHAAAGWIVFAAALVWFFRRRENAPAVALEKTPESYLPHILPKPGFIARHGLNAFLVVVCIGCFFVAAWRQGVWHSRIDSGRLPKRVWFDAVLVVDAPNRLNSLASGEWRVPARIVSVNGKVAEEIPVRFYGAAEERLRRGDMVETRIRVSPPRPPAYPGAFNGAFWLERDGLVANAAVARGRDGGESAFRVLPVDNPPFATRLRRIIDAVRNAAIDTTLAHGGEHGPMLAAMLYGYRDELDRTLNDAFRRVGIGHVLAISGLHVGLVIALLWWLSGWLPWSVRGRSLACLAAAIVYLGLSGGQVAAARATLMAVIHLGARAAGRRGDMLNSLGAAAFIIILNNPTAPLDVGFQLSFTAVAFIHIALRDWGRGPARLEAERKTPPGRMSLFRMKLRRQVFSLTRLSIATWIGLYPVVAYVFQQVNMVGLPINIVVIPMMGAVLAGGLLLPLLGWIPGAEYVLTLPSLALTRTALFADSLPYSSFPVHSPSGWWMAIFYVFVFLYMLNRMMADSAGRKRWLAACFAGLLLGLAGTTASMASLPAPEEGRVSLLPGFGLGVVAAEAPDGTIALVGQLRRQGLDEAGWLHSLRRKGAVSVATLGSGKRDTLEGLRFHYSPVAFANYPLTAKKEANAAPEWKSVPGAEAVRFALVRNEKGGATALVVRTGGKTIATAANLGARDARALASFLRENEGEGSSTYLCLGYADRKLLADMNLWRADWVGVKGNPGAPESDGWFSQSAAGVAELGATLRVYDGGKWLSPKRRE